MKKLIPFLAFVLAAFNAWAIPPIPSISTTAHVVTTTNDGLTNQTNLGAVATGLVKSTVSGGVSTVSTEAPTSGVVNSSGTPATITSSNAALTFGTTSPAVILVLAGPYRLSGQVNVITSSATFAANQSVACEFYRTNNTPGAISAAPSYDYIPIITTLSIRLDTINLETIYTATAGDQVTIYCTLSAAPGAGTVTSDFADVLYLGMFQ
jgi:hypothetical protein